MKFNWYQEKAALRATLNACIRQGMSYEQAEEALRVQFSASCTACTICNMGHTYCDHKCCFVESALNTYLRVAHDKLIEEGNNNERSL